MAPAADAATSGASKVVLYGDSLSAQSENYFNFYVGPSGASVTDHVLSGSAPCDWMSQMQADAASGAEQVAVLQFSGNRFGCMQYADSTDYYNGYQQEMTEAAQAFTANGAHVFIIGAPISYAEVENDDLQWDHLNEIYAGIAAANPGVTFVNAEAAVESGGQFAWSLPCLSFESYCGEDGQNIVRAPDGGHFCPQDPNSVDCAAWESGALRYGMAMAGPVDDYVNGSSTTQNSTPSYEGDPLPSPGSTPTVAAGQSDPYVNVHDALTIVRPLTTGQSLLSLDGRYHATLQPDGNLVVSGPTGPIWATNTAGRGAKSLAVATDGNVVLSGDAGPDWSTDTAGTGGNYLAMQEDGRLVLYGPTGPLWSSPNASTAALEIVGMATTSDGNGYWMTTSAGQVLPFGDATSYGSLAGRRLNAPIIDIAATPDGDGYWLLGADGGVFSFGDAHFYGSTGNVRLDKPVVSMSVTPDGRGYWFVGSDGGIFSYGDARFLGSTGNVHLDRPIVGMASVGDDRGYYLVASDGGIFAFGDAGFAGSMSGHGLAAPIVGMAVDPVGHGYWEVASDGGVFSFRSPFFGSTGAPGSYAPVIGMTPTGDGNGYHLTTSDGIVLDFGDAPFAYVPH